MIVDPVCGAKLEEIDTAVMVCYKGELLAFCCKRCLQEFSENPDAYLRDPNTDIAAKAS